MLKCLKTMDAKSTVCTLRDVRANEPRYVPSCLILGVIFLSTDAEKFLDSMHFIASGRTYALALLTKTANERLIKSMIIGP
jgi:hypothetical protein